MTADNTDNIYNYRFVRDGLISGGQPSEAQLRAFAADGGELVINLALHDDPRYSLPDEAGLVESLGMRYVHIPVQFDRPTAQDLQQFFAAMDAAGGASTLVHCAANMRVSAFLGLYFSLREGQSDDDSWALMRSVWEPDAVWQAFIDEALSRLS